MSVVRFTAPKNLPAGWQFAEIQQLLSACANPLTAGEASSWEVGMTDSGDPQLYLLGPAPDYDCILCVSRLGGLYVLEDGNGQILFEHRNLLLLSKQVRTALSHKRMVILAKAALLWSSLRQTIEQKIEPLLAEQMEVVTHFAPHLAAVA